MTASLALRSLVLLVATVAGAASAQVQTAVEYYYAAWDHYFVTSFADEIAVLDGGAFGGVWKRTGNVFNVWGQPMASTAPTCRFFSTAFAPRSSHFYTPFDNECQKVKASPDWQFESLSFYVQFIDAAGTCPGGTTVLYRLYNNGMGGAPNHRYTTDRAVFTAMQAQGWTFEGNGDTGAFACVPAVEAGAAGVWRGITSAGRAVIVVILDDATYYVIYAASATMSLTGAMQGSGTDANGTFASVRARNVGFRGTFVDGSTVVSGTYTPRSSLQLSFGAGAATETLTAGFDAAANQPGSLDALAGSYTGTYGHAFDYNSMSATIAANGDISIRGECGFTGKATPRSTSRVFDMTVTARSGVCLGGPGKSVTGILFLDTATGQLFGVAPLFEGDMYFVAGQKQ